MTEKLSRQAVYAFSAGICAAASSVFNKLFTSDLRFEDESSTMVLFRGLLILKFTRFGGVVGYRASFMLSQTTEDGEIEAVVGSLLFDEVTSWLGWLGLFLVLFGLVIVTSSQETQQLGKND
uniref:Uncharacterized protein n=1 Tax=Timema shepardi TaxID=629360 RepID=A0A7R9B149_TIMSH|nr:unnamed protein product [Timema shepardi]